MFPLDSGLRGIFVGGCTITQKSILMRKKKMGLWYNREKVLNLFLKNLIAP